MSEPLTSTPQIVTNSPEKKPKLIELKPPPLNTDNKKIVNYLEEKFGFQLERTKPPRFPVHLAPSLLGDDPDKALVYIQQLTKYPRFGYLFYPGEKEVGNNPKEMEKLERKEWGELEIKVSERDSQLPLKEQGIYQAIKESRFKKSGITLLVGYMKLFHDILPTGLKGLVDLEKMYQFSEEISKPYLDYTLTQRVWYGERVARFVVDTLWKFSPDPRPE